MSTRFRPLADRVLLKRMEVEERTAAGIIIPDTAQEKPGEGVVLAVGPGIPNEAGKLQAPEVKVGDRVVFGNSTGTEIIIHGETRLVLQASDILGVIEGDGGG